MKKIYGWLLLLPAFSLLLLFTHYPAIASLVRSFYSNGTALRPQVFVGLENYKKMLSDPVFFITLKNTFFFALGTVPTSIFLSLIMALLANRKIRGIKWIRLAYFTPTILPMIAVANIWLFFYAPQIGLFNKLLNLFGYANINWLGNQNTVLFSLIMMTIWKESGFFMIFYLAALQALPKELHEAGKVEGASSVYYFFRVTFPLLMPTTLFITVNALLNSFKLVDHLFILTKGGPDNASNLLLYYIYEVAFSFFDYSYAATLTIVLLLILLTISLIQFLLIDKRIHYR